MKRKSNLAKIDDIENKRQQALTNAAGTLRKLEIFTKNHRTRAVDFEWPTAADLVRLDCDLETFKLSEINYQSYSCGFASLQFEFGNGIKSNVFTAIGESDGLKLEQKSEVVKGIPCSIDVRVRGNPTDLFEAFTLLEKSGKTVAKCTGHTCGENERFELRPGEQIVGLYGNKVVGDGLLKAVGFIVWKPEF